MASMAHGCHWAAACAAGGSSGSGCATTLGVPLQTQGPLRMSYNHWPTVAPAPNVAATQQGGAGTAASGAAPQQALVDLRWRCACLEDEVQVQDATTRRALEATRRHRAQVTNLEAEARKAALAAWEDGRAFEAETMALATTLARGEALAAEKRELLKRIQAANLALGAKQVQASAPPPAATWAPPPTPAWTSSSAAAWTSSSAAARTPSAAAWTPSPATWTPPVVATPSNAGSKPLSPRPTVDEGAAAERARLLRSTLRELGDANAALSKEVTEEQSRRARAKEATQAELERHEAESKALTSAAAARKAAIPALKDRVDAGRKEELRAKAEAAALQQQAAEIAAQSPRTHSEKEKLMQQIREMAATDAELRQALREAQERLWHQEQRERER